MLDTIISGGTVHTAGASFVGDIAIQGETIVSVGAPGSFARSATPGTRTIDARGMDVIPGCIDVHVHLALPFCGTVSCDDFDSGSRAAACGCVTSLIDFAIPGPGQSLADAHNDWMSKAAGRSFVDFSWHMATTKREHLHEIPACIERGLPTFKQFMIYESEGWNADDAMMFEALELCRAHRGMMLVHAESPRVLDLLIRRFHTPELMRTFGAKLHPITRPNFIEAEAIERCIHWSAVTGGRLYVVHMSTGEGADLIAAAHARGVPVLAETCAQYLCLDDRVFDGPEGHLFACCPQVKKQSDIDRLWQGVQRGEVCIVSTDTCSFTREQKGMWRQGDGPNSFGDWTKIPMGLPGLDTLVPLVYSLGVRQGRISINRLVDLCATTPARVMGLNRKGNIAPGFDADLAIIDPARTEEVDWRNLQSRCDWSPYQGMRLGGFAHTTLARGRVLVSNHRFVADAPHGRLVERRLQPD
ncbi:MAG: amidohydrolase family protein [Planctomycetota bacterium]|nr:amidohydrolase family protein [Planctomycetota bacterium]